MSDPQAAAPRFLLLDGRAKFGDAERTVVMHTAASEAEAVESSRIIWKGSDAIWKEVECKNRELHPRSTTLGPAPSRGCEMTTLAPECLEKAQKLVARFIEFES